jgi:hypothetical protein
MQFVYPGFLFALLAISVPIIIHLFHFRRFRKIYFPNVAFLQHLSDESKKQSRLKHLLVLLARILAITFLVLAFARPFIPVDDATISPEGNSVGVYIDNSFSMEALATTGRLLDQARERAREIAMLYQPTDRFLLLTNDFEGRHQRFMSQEEFLALVDEVQESPAVRTVAGVMERMGELFDGERAAARSAYVISDFQKSTAAIDAMEPDTTMSVFFIPLQAQQAGNVFIDTCWFDTPVKLLGQPVTLKVRIRNDNDHPLESQPVRLHIDGVQRAVASYDVAAQGQTEVELTWTVNTPGIQQGRVEIVDYPVTFDDQLFFSYRSTSEIPVLAINQTRESPFLRALFGRDTTFVFDNMPATSIDFSRFGQYNLIVLHHLSSISPGLARELQQFTEQGGSLVIFPGSGMDDNSYNNFLASMQMDAFAGTDTATTRVTGLNELHEVFSGVFETIPENIDLPVAAQYNVIRRQARSAGQYLLQLENGNHFFTAYPSGRGQTFLSAVPLDDAYSNLPRHPVFVPLMVNIALQSQAYLPLYHVLGGSEPVMLRGRAAGRDEVFRLSATGMEIIPEQRHAGNVTRLFFHDQLQEAGNYMLLQGNEAVRGLSFNYDRRESLLEAYSTQQLNDLILDHGLEQVRVIETGDATFAAALQDFRMGRQLWRHFLVLAIIFLLAEVALLRLWK